MTEESIIRLHNRFTVGKELTSAELLILQNWDAENDNFEDSLLNQSADKSDSENFDKHLTEILTQVSLSAAKAIQLAQQNSSLKLENKTLRCAVESHFAKKAA